MATNESGQSLQRYPKDDPSSPMYDPQAAGASKSNIFMAWDGYWGLSQSMWNLFFVFLVVFGMVGQNVTCYVSLFLF